MTSKEKQYLKALIEDHILEIKKKLKEVKIYSPDLCGTTRGEVKKELKIFENILKNYD